MNQAQQKKAEQEALLEAARLLEKCEAEYGYIAVASAAQRRRLRYEDLRGRVLKAFGLEDFEDFKWDREYRISHWRFPAHTDEQILAICFAAAMHETGDL